MLPHLLFAVHSLVSSSLPFIVLLTPAWVIPYVLVIFILIWSQWQIFGGCVATQWEHNSHGQEATTDNSWKGNFFDKKVRLLYGLDLSEEDLYACGNAYHGAIFAVVALRLLLRA